MNDWNGGDRRSVDPLIVEIHGMVKALVQRVEDHISIDEKEYIKLKEAENRIVTLERTDNFVKTSGKIAAVVLTSGTAFTAFWVWIKSVFAHVKG